MTEISIRDANAEDVPFIARCILAAAGALELKDDWMAQTGDRIALMEELCAMEHSLYCWNHVRIACDRDIPVGCLLAYDGKRYARAREMTFTYVQERTGMIMEDSDMETCRDEYYLDSMSVLPSYRKRGIGHMLMADAMSIGQKLRHTRFSLIADKEVPALQRHYASVGFEIEEEIRFFGHQYYRMLRCERNLTEDI